MHHANGVVWKAVSPPPVPGLKHAPHVASDTSDTLCAIFPPTPRPCVRSHSFTVPSAPQLTTARPHGLAATLSAHASCPGNDCVSDLRNKAT